MAINIGPKIGIDGEAQFRKEINALVQQQKTLASEMKAVTSAFDQKDKSEKNLTAQTKILNQQIQVQQQRIEKLKEGLSAASKELGEADSRTLKWKQAINDATTDLNKMTSQLSNLEKGVDDVADSLGNAEKSSFSFTDAISAQTIVEAIKGIGSAIADVIENTKEYRTIIASLDISSQKAGYSAQETAQTYEKLYGVLSDDQTTATTTANLQALQLSQEKLTELTNASIGAWATYGDSIPIDGLAEAINETVKAGQVTGTFADVLNWGSKEGETFGVTLKANTEANKEWNDAVKNAATAEDFFNLALQEASTEAERADLVLQAMANQGLVEAGEAWQKNNEDIVNANNAQLNFQKNAAELADRVSPAVTAVKDGFNEIFKEILNLTENVDFSAITQQIQEGFSYFIEDILPQLVGLFKFVFENKELLISAIAGIGAAFVTWNVVTMIQGVVSAIKAFKAANEGATIAQLALNAAQAANPIGIVIAAITGLVAALVVLWNTNEGFRNAVIGIWENIKQIFADAWENIKTVWDAVKPYFEVVWSGIKLTFSVVGQVLTGYFQAAWNGIVFVWDVVTGYFQNIWNTIKGIFSVVKSILSGDFQGAWDAIKQILSGWSDYFKGLFDSLVNIFGGVLDFFKNVGGNIIQGIKDGISAAWDGLVSWFNNLWNGLFGKKTVNVDVATTETRTVKTINESAKPTRPRNLSTYVSLPETAPMDISPLRAAYETIDSSLYQRVGTQLQQGYYRVQTAMGNAVDYTRERGIQATSSKSTVIDMGGINITVNPAPGMDENALAEKVSIVLENLFRQKEGLWA